MYFKQETVYRGKFPKPNYRERREMLDQSRGTQQEKKLGKR